MGKIDGPNENDLGKKIPTQRTQEKLLLLYKRNAMCNVKDRLSTCVNTEAGVLVTFLQM